MTKGNSSDEPENKDFTDMSSPMDTMVGIKKKRLAAMQAKNKAKAKPATE